MRPVLRPGSPLLRRDAEHLQLGTEPGHALVLNADGPLAELLCTLDGVRTHEDPDLDTPTVEALLAAGVIVDADAWRGEAGLEREAVHLLSRGLDAEAARRQLARRRAAEIRIVGGDDLTAPLTGLLEASGIGTVSTGGPPRPGVDVTILAVDGEAARELGDECLRADVPHLVAAVRDGCGVVGPLVLPGRTACLRCVDTERASLDAAWPAVLAQLSRPLSASSSSPFRAASAILDAAVAVLAARDILAQLAGEPALTHNHTVRVGPDLADLRRHRWTLQPDCGCTLLA